MSRADSVPNAVPVDRAQLVAQAVQTIRSGSKSFHAASQLFDATTRERAWLLYSWCRHCDDVCDGQILGHAANGPSAPGRVAELDALTRRTLAGHPPDSFPFQALAAVLRECPIPHRYILDHVQGFALDAEDWRPQDEDDLLTYCYHVAGAVGCMMAVVMGVDPADEATLATASALGIAFQLSNIARDIADDHEAGRCYLPVSWQQLHGLDADDPLDPAARPALTAIVARLTQLAAHYEEKARAGVPQLAFRARWAVLAAARIYGEIGRRVAALGPNAWDARVIIRRRTKLGFLCSSFVESLRTRKGRHGSFRIDRTAAAGSLSPAVPPSGGADRPRA